LEHAACISPELAPLPAELLSHSEDHHDLGVRLLWRAMECLIEKIGVQVCVARSKSEYAPDSGDGVDTHA
jgi:hypothetical protein